jgi:hypothetical protein
MRDPALLASKLAALSKKHDCSDFWGNDAFVCVPETTDGEDRNTTSSYS